MERRRLGRTGLDVSLLGFGCGAVGGLMVRGAMADQERTVARAVSLGVNYFDTAPQYGSGASEMNLGRVLRDIAADVLVGTKVRVPAADFGRLGQAIPRALEQSLQRLERDGVDLFQLHNPIGAASAGETLGVEAVLGEVVPAFRRLIEQGKTRFAGFTAVGDTAALLRVVESGGFDTAQVPYNMLNPSAGGAVASGYPGQDYQNLIGRAEAKGLGVIVIRVLAAGALSGSDARHPIAAPEVAPIASGRDYATDLARARRLMPVAATAGASDLAEAAFRFPLAHTGVGTVLVGSATLQEFEHAASALEKGRLPPAAMSRLAELQAGFAGEER